MDHRPLAYLTIIPRGAMTSYRVTDTADRLLDATRAYSTPEGQQGARERMRAWIREKRLSGGAEQSERRAEPEAARIAKHAISHASLVLCWWRVAMSVQRRPHGCQ